MVSVGGRPVVDYLVERMRVACCSELRVVTRPEKRDLAEHARRLGARVIEGYPPSVADSLLLALDGLAPDDTVVFGLPDSIWEPRDGFTALVGALDDAHDVVLGLFRSPEPERSDVVTLAPGGAVTAVDVKPARPRSDLVWGCGAARAGALGGLAGHEEPGRYFDALAKAGRVRGVDLGTEFVDIGTRASLSGARSRFERR